MNITDSTATINKYGSKIWRNSQGQIHRTGGPATEYPNGYKEWWVNGQLHRTDGPAIEYSDGSEEWWVNGKRHRTDGPAIEWADGDKSWWINSEELSYHDFLKSLPDQEAMYVALIHGAP